MTTAVERSAILENIRKLTTEKLFHPWWSVEQVKEKAATITKFRAELNGAPEDQFERRINSWLTEFQLSHMAFFHASGRGVPPQFAIGAELRAFANGGEYAWFVQYVAEGGVAYHAGIRLGDAVLAVNGRNVTPPDEPRFQLGLRHEILLQPRDESHARVVKLELPKGTVKDRLPMVTSRPLSHEILPNKIGLIRVSAFPGAVGFDFARTLDGIVAELKAAGCGRLIIDLRGIRAADLARCA